MAPANLQRGFPAVVMGPQFKESKSKSRLFNRAKHAQEARRRESVRSKMVFVLTMDVDDEDIHQTWIKDVTQARY